MRHGKVATLFVALTMALAIVGCQGGDSAAPGSVASQPAPELKADHWLNTNGAAPTLASLRGNVVVLDFWAYS